MVEWFLSLEESIIKIQSNLILSAPCKIEFQKQILADLQSAYPRFYILDDKQRKHTDEVPILFASHLLNLRGQELKDHFLWWCESLKLQLDDEDFKHILPKSDAQWSNIKLEKKIALFLGALLKVRKFSLSFLEDLHLDENSQIFLLNYLKGIASKHENYLILFWSFRLQIPGTQNLYFSGFKNDRK